MLKRQREQLENLESGETVSGTNFTFDGLPTRLQSELEADNLAYAQHCEADFLRWIANTHESIGDHRSAYTLRNQADRCDKEAEKLEEEMHTLEAVEEELYENGTCINRPISRDRLREAMKDETNGVKRLVYDVLQEQAAYVRIGRQRRIRNNQMILEEGWKEGHLESSIDDSTNLISAKQFDITGRLLDHYQN